MGYFGWKPYVPVAERRKQAEKAAAKMQKKGVTLTPVIGGRGSIAKTFWGKAWCDNLERYSDYENRLPRGRTYVRNGSVIDLKVAEGVIQAQVMGSRVYKVAVSVAAVPAPQWQAISADCAGSIATLVELLQGKLSNAVMERICTPKTGLFPAPKEISFTCSCPDWAAMCKHVAAVLYGIGVRLDAQPDLLFSLRRVDAKELVAQAGAALPKNKKAPAPTKVLDASLLADVFGIEMAEASPPAARGKLAAAKEKLPTAKKAPAIKKSAAVKKPAAAKKAAQINKSASKRNSASVKAGAGTATPKRKPAAPKRKPTSEKKK
ncbi:MAG: hypothetical protein NUV63_01425 [Gallionella sp.]|nr:hypothetical protein [Gallionella sp.]